MTNPARRSIPKDFYTYQAFFADLAGGASASDSFTIETDSDFRVEKLSYFAHISEGAQTANSRVIPLVTVKVLDTGSGRQMMKEALPVPALFGPEHLPFVLPQAKIFGKNATVTVDVANLTAGTQYDLYLCFHGTKLYR